MSVLRPESERLQYAFGGMGGLTPSGHGRAEKRTMAITRSIRVRAQVNVGLCLALGSPAIAFGQTAAFPDAPPAEADGVIPPEPAADEPARTPPPAAEPEPAAPAPSTPSALWSEKPEPPHGNFPKQDPACETASSGLNRARPWTLFAALTHTAYGGSDFNGGGLLFLPSAGNRIDTTLVPSFGSGTGFLLGIGFGAMPGRTGRVGAFLDLTYSATWLSPRSVLTENELGQAVFHQVNVPLRFVYRPSRFVAPYLEGSVGGGWTDVAAVHGYVDLNSETFESDGALGHFGGMTLGVGVGSYFIVQEYLALDAYVGYGTFILASIKDIPLEEVMTAPSWTFRLGPTFFL